MSSANPLSFLGGMFLEIGAAIAVLAILWQPQQGDARPTLQPTDFFASRPVHYSANNEPAYSQQPVFAYPQQQPDRGDLQPALPNDRPTTFTQRPLPVEQSYMPVNQRPLNPQRGWNEEYRLLPPAPPSYPEMPRESRVETARPLVRGFVNQVPTFEQQPRHGYSAPLQRTAEARRNEYYNRY